MLDTLRLVRGTVSDKDLVPILTHFHFYNGRLQGTDDRVTLDASCTGIEGTLTVPADKFLLAVDACDGEPKLSLSETGRLTISRGKFRAQLQTLPGDSFPRRELLPTDVPRVKAPANLLEALRRLVPFISNDASRPWSMAVLIKDGYAYATNNVQLVRTPFKSDIPMTIPARAINELLRVALPPLTMCATERVVQFEYKDFWLSCQQSSLGWPDVAPMFDARPKKIIQVPAGLKKAVERVSRFSPDQAFPVVKITSECVSTLEGVHQATFEGFGLPDCAFHAQQLLLCLSEATHVDFGAYPKPIHWYGDGIEGIVTGVQDR